MPTSRNGALAINLASVRALIRILLRKYRFIYNGGKTAYQRHMAAVNALLYHHAPLRGVWRMPFFLWLRRPRVAAERALMASVTTRIYYLLAHVCRFLISA